MKKLHGDFTRLPAAIVLGLLAILAATPVTGQAVDPVVNGEALVRLTETATIADFNAVYQTVTLRAIPSRNIYLVQIAPGDDPEQFKTAANADPDTVWVELNYFGQVPEARGRCFYTTAGADAQQYLNQPAWDQINLPTAAAQSTGDGVVVAIVDSGIDSAHITLSNAILPGGWNFVDDTANTADVGDGFDNDNDGQIDEMTGHGTHVAGIVRMVAPDAWLLPIKVLDSEGLSDNFTVAAGIFYAIDQGADVINVSVGSTYNSEAVLDAVVEAQSRGIIVAAAGGNADTHLPEEYPALNQGVISVASVNEVDQKGWFSNWHESFVVNAPGEQIFSTFPGDIYAAWDGTSMSTPMISGVAALILARHPEWSLDQARVNNVRVALVQSADNIDGLNPAYAGMLGAGRLNAAAAVSQVDAFSSAVTYSVGAAPEAVAVADLDGDGIADLAVANLLANTISVLLHDTTKTFAPSESYPVGLGPCDITHGDFDLDGDVDLAVLNETASTVSVLINNGAGVFGAPVDYAAGFGASAITAIDVDGDNDDDLAIAQDGADSVLLMLNAGGVFTPGGSITVGSRPVDVISADLNGDNLPDLVSANRASNNLSIVLNAGGGSFDPAVHHPVGTDPRSVTAGDFDGDGAVDLACANQDSRDISVLINDAAGGVESSSLLSFNDGRKATNVASADLNCDGFAEIIASNSDVGINAASVFISRGDGSFHTPVHYPAGAIPAGVYAADLDGDLDADVAVVGSGDSTVYVLLNETSAFCGTGIIGDLDGNCTVGLADLTTLLASYGTPAGAVYVDGDLDKDGDVDLADLATLLASYGATCN